jgi:hypothetical protein
VRRLGLALALAGLGALWLAARPAQALAMAPRLLARYEPVAHFDRLEAFLPTKVQSFIADADLEREIAPNSWTVVDTHPRASQLPGPGSGTWRLNQDTCTPSAPIGGLSCYAQAFQRRGGGPSVYGRMAREDGEIVLQYWFFYYDDVFSYQYPPSDFIWQAHEGDWEVVNVVLSGDGRPLSAGYSQHCGGERRAWADVPRVDGTHPVVYVALGSHANYFSAGTHPINLGCLPGAVVALFNQAHLPLPVDYAFDGPVIVGPPHVGARVMPVRQISDRHPEWVRFPGFWGELEYLHAPAPIGTVTLGGSSPVGPAFHDVWTDPLGTMAAWPGA